MALRRVLLLSPLRSHDPANGDVTYTEHLLSAPPSGVAYVSYADALTEGSLVERYRRAAPRRGARDRVTFVREAVINRARRENLLFREPFRHFHVRRGAFDVVHAHVFSVGLDRGAPPLVISNSVPIDALYRDGFGVTRRRAQAFARIDAALAKRTGVAHSSFDHQEVRQVVCFSDYLRDWFVRRGGDPERYAVVPPAVALPPPAPRRPPPPKPIVGFVGDFDVKGGQIVVDAQRLLRRRGVETDLVVVGSEPRLGERESHALGITWLPRQPSTRLLQEIIPTFSVFAYPTRFDGLPLTLLEVMAAGVPAVVSDYGALPEVVDFGRAGVVVPRDSPEALVAALRDVLRPGRAVEIGEAGRRRVAEKYDARRNAELLGHVYLAAISGARSG